MMDAILVVFCPLCGTDLMDSEAPLFMRGEGGGTFRCLACGTRADWDGRQSICTIRMESRD